MAKKKFYAIRGGLHSDIFTTWAECEQAKKNKEFYGKLAFKGFPTKEQAENYIKGDDPNGIYIDELKTEGVIFAYTDGSWDSYLSMSSYGIVFVKDLKVIKELSGVTNSNLAEFRQIAGELMGAVNATKAGIRSGLSSLTIAHDLEGVEAWATGRYKGNNVLTDSYQQKMKELMGSIEINFVKVPAHSKIKFNERADELAKCALKEHKEKNR